MRKRIYTSLLSIFISILSFSQDNGALNGNIRETITGKPVYGATITIDQLKLSRVTDSIGNYSFINLPAGSYSLTITAVGYETQTKYNIPISAGNSNEISFELQPLFKSLNEITVAARRRTARATSLETPLSVQRLTTEEIKSSPGSNFDISRVVQSLPGITGSDGIGNGFRNDIIIRGGAPYENVYYLDGIEVPVINHFSTQGSAGGPQGILNVSFIEDVRVSTSAFDAKYDNALSGVFEFKQKNGNTKRIQSNVRLSASELSVTVDGPLNKEKNLTFLASARRSYLQFLFKALDLPIRPDYYDFQYKISWIPNTRNSFSFIGLGAIDQFEFGSIRKPTLEKYLILDFAPSNNQWNYTVGGSWKRSLKNGSVNTSLSRNVLDVDIIKYESNIEGPSRLRLRTNSRETENKLRVDIAQVFAGWKLTYGISAQLVDYFNNSYVRRRAEVRDTSGNIIQPADIFSYNTSLNFSRYGLYLQAGKRFLDQRLSTSIGIRTDGNSFLNKDKSIFTNFSPRIALSYQLSNNWTLNASVGSYTKMPPFTVLGFQQNNIYLNKNARYLRSTHYVAGLEYLPKPTLRFTVEGFYKKYNRVPVSLRDGISLNNLGADYTAVGNEPIISSGKGEAYGIEFFAQQKLTTRLFGFFSYTYVISRYSGLDEKLLPSAWDNRNLLSFTLGYKFKRNWELGLKYRFQGGLPYTPFNEELSRQNYITYGNGILDYTRFNTLRLKNFQQSDIRIDKKWNFRKTTLDVFVDVLNWTAFKLPISPGYTFDRELSTGKYLTTDGRPLRSDGSNAIPKILLEDQSVPLPTVGIIFEF